MSELPPEFIQTIQNVFGKKGERWLAWFPELLDEASRRWGLTDIQPVSKLSYNFVAFAQVDTGSNVPRHWMQSQPAPTIGPGETFHSARVVLKLGVPHRELTSEIASLRNFNGRGVVQLLDADPEKGMFLLERLIPGRMLATFTDDEDATRIAAEVMNQLWQSVPEDRKDLIQLRVWFDGFKRLRKCYNGGTGEFPKALVEMAEALSADLLAENKDEILMHGDFHHFNVLESERGWLAIDPKGVIGPKGYEVGPFLINPFDRFLNGSNPRVQTEKRIAILSETLGLERECLRSWGICHAVLSAWWCVEGNNPDYREYALRCAEVFTQVRV